MGCGFESRRPLQFNQMKYLDDIVKSFRYESETKKTPRTVWRVKINGQFVTTCSGKTVWKRIGDAKNAIHNHVDDWVSRLPWSERRETKYDFSHSVLKTMMEQGIIEFVELPIDTILKP